jgi:hypothetical protein
MNDWGFFKDFTAFTKLVTETLMDLITKINMVLSFLLGKETAYVAEIADLKALESIPHQLARLLRKSQEKTVKTPNSKQV